MNGIDPKWVFWLGILVTIETAIGQGTVKLTSLVADQWIPAITGWCTLLSFIGNVVMTGLAGYSSRTAGPLVKPVVLAAVILGSLFAFSGDAHAQIKLKPLTGDVGVDLGLKKPSAITGNPLSDIIGALDAKLLPDLNYALKLANASGSKVTGPCYQAWIDIINVRQKAVTADDGSPIDLPTPHLVTDFEKLVELRNSLQPDSEFMIKCSPVASMVKKDIVGFIGIVISGGAGLATLVPGL
jgi:hypothetical protein